MENRMEIRPAALQLAAAGNELAASNSLSQRYGLSLTDAEIQTLAECRASALRDTGRVEFGGGVLPVLIYAFCDSPYLTRENYLDTLIELQDSFYYFKNESAGWLSDDELIEAMRNVFNGVAQGSLDYLAGTSLEELCRDARAGRGLIRADAPEGWK